MAATRQGPGEGSSVAGGYFRFDESWRLAADPDRVAEVLADLASYPVWWRQVRSVEPAGPGRAEVAIRSILPMTLRVLLGRVDKADAGRLLRVSIDGDLIGFAQWTIRPQGRATVASFRQEVRVDGPLLRASAAVFHPVLSWNHAMMMRAGEWGLAAHLNAPVAR